jgi:hypothetical protein
MAVVAITKPELALEIDAPEVVGGGAGGRHPCVRNKLSPMCRNAHPRRPKQPHADIMLILAKARAAAERASADVRLSDAKIEAQT